MIETEAMKSITVIAHYHWVQPSAKTRVRENDQAQPGPAGRG